MSGDHTPGPWFMSGVRFRMSGSQWISVNRYDEALKQDQNIACVGYDPRTGEGQADAAFIVRAVNAHDDLVAALKEARSGLMASTGGADGSCGCTIERIDAALAQAVKP